MGSSRLEDSVGRGTASEVQAAVRAGRTETWVITTRPDGRTQLEVLDSLARPKDVNTSNIIGPGTRGIGVRHDSSPNGRLSLLEQMG